MQSPALRGLKPSYTFTSDFPGRQYQCEPQKQSSQDLRFCKFKCRVTVLASNGQFKANDALANDCAQNMALKICKSYYNPNKVCSSLSSDKDKLRTCKQKQRKLRDDCIKSKCRCNGPDDKSCSDKAGKLKACNSPSKIVKQTRDKKTGKCRYSNAKLSGNFRWYGEKKTASFVYKGGNKDEPLYICTDGVKLPGGMNQFKLSSGNGMRLQRILVGTRPTSTVLKATPTGSCAHGAWECPSIKGKLTCPQSVWGCVADPSYGPTLSRLLKGGKCYGGKSTCSKDGKKHK